MIKIQILLWCASSKYICKNTISFTETGQNLGKSYKLYHYKHADNDMIFFQSLMRSTARSMVNHIVPRPPWSANHTGFPNPWILRWSWQCHGVVQPPCPWPFPTSLVDQWPMACTGCPTVYLFMMQCFNKKNPSNPSWSWSKTNALTSKKQTTTTRVPLYQPSAWWSRPHALHRGRYPYAPW